MIWWDTNPFMKLLNLILQKKIKIKTIYIQIPSKWIHSLKLKVQLLIKGQISRDQIKEVLNRHACLSELKKKTVRVLTQSQILLFLCIQCLCALSSSPSLERALDTAIIDNHNKPQTLGKKRDRICMCVERDWPVACVLCP